jgi:hypothetical protein
MLLAAVYRRAGIRRDGGTPCLMLAGLAATGWVARRRRR